MPTVETELRLFKNAIKQEIALLKKIIVTRMVTEKWVKQDVACALLNVKKRQLANIRIHVTKDGKLIGVIGWKKSSGKNILYYLPDIEKYNSAHVIMN